MATVSRYQALRAILKIAILLCVVASAMTFGAHVMAQTQGEEQEGGFEDVDPFQGSKGERLQVTGKTAAAIYHALEHAGISKYLTPGGGRFDISTLECSKTRAVWIGHEYVCAYAMQGSEEKYFTKGDPASFVMSSLIDAGARAQNLAGKEVLRALDLVCLQIGAPRVDEREFWCRARIL